MTSNEREFFVKGVRWTINRLSSAGLIRSIKYGQPRPGVATEDAERAEAEVARALERRFRRGGPTLARGINFAGRFLALRPSTRRGW
jgi:hypothetical protein